MQNKMINLHNHLFEQMERLNDEELSNEDLQKEIQRAKAMTDVSEQILSNASLALKAEIERQKYVGGEFREIPLLKASEGGGGVIWQHKKDMAIHMVMKISYIGLCSG